MSFPFFAPSTNQLKTLQIEDSDSQKQLPDTALRKDSRKNVKADPPSRSTHDRTQVLVDLWLMEENRYVCVH